MQLIRRETQATRGIETLLPVARGTLQVHRNVTFLSIAITTEVEDRQTQRRKDQLNGTVTTWWIAFAYADCFRRNGLFLSNTPAVVVSICGRYGRRNLHGHL
jgi:hypothetical protein